VPNAIAKAFGRLRFYLDGGGGGSSSSSRSALTSQEYANRERRRRDRHKAAHRSEFADSDVPPPHIAADLELAYTWALDFSVTTTEMSKRRLRHVDGEMAEHGRQCRLLKGPPPSPPAHVVDGRGRVAHDAGGSGEDHP
jgi:hypothetical protein